MRKGKRRWWLFAIITILVVAGVVAGVLLTRQKTAAVHYLTASVSKGTVAETVQADFSLVGANDATTLTSGSGTSSATSSTASTGTGSSANTSSSSTSSSSTVSTSTSGVVTDLALTPGAAPHSMRRLLTVSGIPLYAFVSSTPLYENLSVNLSSGTDTANVKALQRALKSLGYYSGAVDGDFGTTTQTAVEAWQADRGLTQTGEIDMAQFVWVPTGAVLNSWNVSIGSPVSGSTALATVVFPRDLVAQALVTQADVSSLKLGQKATLTIDGHTTDPFTGTITFIDDQPASSSSSAGSSSTVEYTVDLAVHHLPSLAKSGMTGTLVVTIAKRTNVLVVPTSAVRGSFSTAYVQVMADGKPALRQVATGMATASLTEITSGLAAGEVVVTGQYSNTATGTSATSGGFGIPGLGGGGGGFFRRNGSSSSGSGGFSGAPGATGGQ